MSSSQGSETEEDVVQCVRKHGDDDCGCLRVDYEFAAAHGDECTIKDLTNKAINAIQEVGADTCYIGATFNVSLVCLTMLQLIIFV